jgi:DNA-3-methyladenine glycosylase
VTGAARRAAAILRERAADRAITIAGIDFSAASVDVARRLIGVALLFDGVGGRIVEVEAYDREDPASHSHSGPTARNASMFGPPGRAYVYRSYGLHWCLNFVCREAGHGAGVLIRALEPLHGLAAMRRRRGAMADRLLCAGPGRLTEALGIDRSHDGLALDAPPFELRTAAGPIDVVSGPRIGISKAIEVPWRFGLRGSPCLSRPFVTSVAQRRRAP